MVLPKLEPEPLHHHYQHHHQMVEVEQQEIAPPPPPAATHDEPPKPASPPRFDPSRMIGIIKRKALIKDLAAAYHAECLTYCQELLELQKKLEEPRVETRIPEESRKETRRPAKRVKKSR